MKEAAVFLDRDGTLIEDPGYLNDPAAVRLLPGVGSALARLRSAGFRLIVVTNQSGIARGRITPEQYEAVAARTAELLGNEGGSLDAQYFCPHLPEISGPCECRKPGLLLFRQAIDEWDLDPARSWWIGDNLRDVSPAKALGGHGILITRNPATVEALAGLATAADLPDAADLILAGR